MSSSLCKTSVLRIYQEVIDDVIIGVRELFLEDGVDEQVLLELKQTWESKLMASKAVQNEQEEKSKKQEQQHAASNGFPKVANNAVPQSVPVQQQPTQQPIAPQIQQIVETKQVPIQITLPPQPGTDGTQRVLTIQVPASALQGNQLQKVLTGPVITATMGLPVSIASSLLQQHVNAALSSQQQAQVQQPTVVKTVGQTDGTCDDDGAGCSQVRNDKKLENILAEKLAQVDGMDDDSDDGCSIEIIVPTVRRNRKGAAVSAPGAACSKRAARSSPALSRLAPPPAQCDGAADTSDDDDDASDDADADDDDPDDDKQDDDDEMEDEGGEEEPLNSEDDVTDDDPADLFDTDNIVVCQYDKIIRNRNKWKFYLKDGIMNLNGQDYVFQKATGDAEW
ncbi:unnamed protein product [Callosobruchus maculatus]|uniref:Transcription initiation factor IIA subunit 1 n=1 Tax=Callosobruchus maculatus TaxID=64391 RepID=A0A653DH33_CALMS|nr:unnamed protein product [Callosobruchus maculatus]